MTAQPVGPGRAVDGSIDLPQEPQRNRALKRSLECGYKTGGEQNLWSQKERTNSIVDIRHRLIQDRLAVVRAIGSDGGDDTRDLVE
jgi:hypothetical protein